MDNLKLIPDTYCAGIITTRGQDMIASLGTLEHRLALQTHAVNHIFTSQYDIDEMRQIISPVDVRYITHVFLDDGKYRRAPIDTINFYDVMKPKALKQFCKKYGLTYLGKDFGHSRFQVRDADGLRTIALAKRIAVDTQIVCNPGFISEYKKS